ncbi:MAG: hypothetical protein PVF13_05420 [Chromatiales bacterium]|jgi:hypothetical protein
MSMSDESPSPVPDGLGVSAEEFLDYCNAERERRLSSGESFDQEAFDAAVQMVLDKLRVLADEGWT